MLIEKVRGEYRYCRIPGLVLTEKGTLLGYYECRRSVSDWADIDIKIIRSTDKGKSWETVDVIRSNGQTLNNPVMVVKGSVVHFLYCENYKKLFCCKSLDDGKSFSEKRDITDVVSANGFFFNAFAIGPGHGIVHRGNILIPVWISQNRENERAHGPAFISVLYSADNGESWALGDSLGKDFLVSPSECALAVNKDGNVLISIRNRNPEGVRAFAISENGYSDWYGLHLAENMPDPVCQGSMAYENGKVYHINCASQTERVNLTVKVSENNFESFREIQIDASAGYSDIAVKDGEAYILYERDSEEDGLYFKHIAFKEL